MAKVTKQKSILAFAVATGMCLTSIAIAEPKHPEDAEYDAASDDGGIERIEDAGQFEALSQQLPAAACIFAKSSHSDHLEPLLHAVIHEFDKDMKALLFGDEEQHIVGGETNHRVLQHLEKLDAIWQPFKQAAEDLIVGKNVDESLAYIFNHNLELLHEAEYVFTEVSTEYANPVLVTEAEALLLDFSSRERMLTEKIAKEACAVVSGYENLGSLADLKKSVSTFEAILNALINGMPSVGVTAAPTEEIKHALKEAQHDWSKVTDMLADVTGKDSIDHDALEKLFELLEEKRANMNAIEKLYATYAHTHH